MDLLRVPSGKTVLAFGLDWRVLDPFASKHEQISRWKNEGMVLQAHYTAGSDTFYGLQREKLPAHQAAQLSGLKLVSAGACAALHPALKGKSALVTIEVESDADADSQGAVAVIGLIRGQVVLDVLCDGAGRLAELRQEFGAGVKGPYEHFGAGGQASGETFTLQDLVSKSRGAELGELRSTRLATIVGAVAVVLLAGWGGWELYASYLSGQKQNQLIQMAKQNSPEAQYKRAVDVILNTPAVSLASALAIMRDSLRDMPVVHQGWELRKVTCPAAGSCTAEFSRVAESGSTMEDFKRNLPVSWTGPHPVGQDAMAVTLKLPFVAAKLDRAAWPRAEELRDRNFSKWQFLAPGGWRAEYSTASIQGLPGGLTPQQAAPLHMLPEAIFAMPLQVSAQPWWYAEHDVDNPMSEDLIGAQTVMTGDIELVLTNKSIQFSAKGLSYVQR